MASVHKRALTRATHIIFRCSATVWMSKVNTVDSTEIIYQQLHSFGIAAYQYDTLETIDNPKLIMGTLRWNCSDNFNLLQSSRRWNCSVWFLEISSWSNATVCIFDIVDSSNATGAILKQLKEFSHYGSTYFVHRITLYEMKWTICLLLLCAMGVSKCWAGRMWTLSNYFCKRENSTKKKWCVKLSTKRNKKIKLTFFITT